MKNKIMNIKNISKKEKFDIKNSDKSVIKNTNLGLNSNINVNSIEIFPIEDYELESRRQEHGIIM